MSKKLVIPFSLLFFILVGFFSTKDSLEQLIFVLIYIYLLFISVFILYFFRENIKTKRRNKKTVAFEIQTSTFKTKTNKNLQLIIGGKHKKGTKNQPKK